MWTARSQLSTETIYTENKNDVCLKVNGRHGGRENFALFLELVGMTYGQLLSNWHENTEASWIKTFLGT